MWHYAVLERTGYSSRAGSRTNIQSSAMWSIIASNMQLICSSTQRQTVVSQFYQLDRLVVEGGKTVCEALDDPPVFGWVVVQSR
jgi:hypothetical protein